MSVRKRGDKYTVDVAVNGKRIQKTVGPNKREAIAVEAKIKEDARRGEFFGFSESAPPFKQLAKKHLELYKAKRSIETESALLKPAIEAFGDRRVNEVAQFDIEKYRAGRMNTPTRFKGKRKPSTCNREIAALHRVFQCAVRWKMIRVNPVSGLEPLEEARGRARFLTKDEARSLLESSPAHLAPIIAVALGTGMRKGEILKLKWDDVDFDRRLIYIRQVNAKTGVARHVPMSEAVCKVFSSIARNGCVYVFSDGNGKPYRDNRTAFKNALKKAEIRNFRFHDLRHTAASYMVMAGVPMRTVGDILGHTTDTMTERYAHLLPEHRLKAVESLPDWRGNAQA